MNEQTKIILGIIASVIAVITAIFGFAKAYTEYKKSKGKTENKSNSKTTVSKSNTIDNSKIKGDVKQTTDSNNTTNSNNTSDSSKTTVHGGITIINNKSSDTQKNGNSISIDNNSEHILLKEQYTSLFAENGSVHSEKITIRNLGNGLIEGDVFLDGESIYSLSGTFRNRILTGEFTSVDNYSDERGTINLKLISDNILSGFCSFSKISMTWDDQIRVSPYVWVSGENKNLLNGTYEFCTQCHNEKKKCCCASTDIDMPVILMNEAKKIQSTNPRVRRMRDFSKNIGNTPVRQINEITDEKAGNHCYFYDCDENKCKIYNIRPTDCRLFPFDIQLDSNTNEYWIGYYSDLCERRLPDIETMKQYAHILRPQLFLLFPYANTINNEEVCKRLKSATFEKLYKLEQFIF